MQRKPKSKQKLVVQSATALAIATLAIPSLQFLVGDNVLFRITEQWVRESPPISQASPENVTVIEYRRGNGGYRTLGNVAEKASALGFRTIRWASKGMLGNIEKGWGVSPSTYNTTAGAIYYPRALKAEAQLVQRTLTRGNHALAQTIPLVEARMPEAAVFLGPETVAHAAILVYAPD
ncbi:hypothetical protein KAJ83_10415 [Marivibrio halodurans]|uniref:Uncharacterized protein n=1 Tax=Marivibrio halodurans TaxID=2039722 RepID=A0A8J7SN53_9PROT|nr:hypothetical protein [Marivibrio halodurans]MBP5857421.1 hypothetical protein [Marivibrio halodurans]